MRARITVLTLGVADLEKSYAFYNALGFSGKGIIGEEFENGAVAFFELQGGLRLALWPRKSLSVDSGIVEGATSSLEFSLGHNVDSKQEVDAIIKHVKSLGASIVKEPADTFYGGYAAYFADPDGHLWEVVWNPEFDNL